MVIVTVKYKVPAEQVGLKRESHINFLVELHKQGLLANAGRKSEGDGGIIILNVQGETEARQIIAADPYQQAGYSEYEYITFQERF